MNSYSRKIPREIQVQLINSLKNIEINESNLSLIYQFINGLHQDLIEKGYQEIYRLNNLSFTIKQKLENENKIMKKHPEYFLNYIHKSNSKYFERKIVPLIEKYKLDSFLIKLDTPKFDLHDDFSFEDYKSKIYNSLYTSAKDLIRLIRCDYHANIFIEKYFDYETNFFSFRKISRKEIKKKLKKIKLFVIDSKVYTSWDSFERYRWDFLGWIRFINPSSEKDYQLISYFQGFNYKLLDNYDEKLISNYLRLIHDVIAGDNEEKYNYILNWISNLIKNPGCKNSKSIIITGSPDILKESFINVLRKLFIGYTNKLNSVFDLKNKDLIENKIILFIKDSSKNLDKLNSTEINNLIILSQETNLSNYEIFNIDYLDIDMDLWIIADELEDDFYDNLLTFFMKRDISNFHPLTTHFDE